MSVVLNSVFHCAARNEECPDDPYHFELSSSVESDLVMTVWNLVPVAAAPSRAGAASFLDYRDG